LHIFIDTLNVIQIGRLVLINIKFRFPQFEIIEHLIIFLILTDQPATLFTVFSIFLLYMFEHLEMRTIAIFLASYFGLLFIS